jgi:hypothetical protein
LRLLGTVRFAPANPILAVTRRLGTPSLLFRCSVLEDDAPPDQAIIVAGCVKAVRGRDIEYLRVWVPQCEASVSGNGAAMPTVPRFVGADGNEYSREPWKVVRLRHAGPGLEPIQEWRELPPRAHARYPLRSL